MNFSPQRAPYLLTEEISIDLCRALVELRRSHAPLLQRIRLMLARWLVNSAMKHSNVVSFEKRIVWFPRLTN